MTTAFLKSDGTYTDWVAGAMTESGKWAVENNKTCFHPDKGEARCSTDGPVGADGIIRGKVGADVSLERAQEAARLTALSMLATVQDELGSLDRIKQIVKVFGMVNCAPGFNRTPEVMNGCSDVLVAIFGEAGRHTRSAVGMAELPFDIAVEIEMILEVE